LVTEGRCDDVLAALMHCGGAVMIWVVDPRVGVFHSRSD
jgi:hypothetical protein